MKIKLNGEISELQDGITIAGLLQKLQLEPEKVAVEVNLSIIKKCDFQKYTIKNSDAIEIVNFVGGG